MAITTPTILDQINVEKTKASERLVRLDADRAQIAAQLIDLETAERVMARVSKPPRAKRSTSAAAAEAKTPAATRGRGAAAKDRHTQVSETRTRRAEPRLGRARSCLGHRQNPTRALRGMSQRSPELCRHRGSAPYPCCTYPGARRQTLCDTDRYGAGIGDGLTRDHRSATAQFLNWFKRPFPGQGICEFRPIGSPATKSDDNPRARCSRHERTSSAARSALAGRRHLHSRALHTADRVVYAGVAGL